MDVLTQAAQFVLSLSILIVLHELGHFIPAKLFKTKVEKFYLFFDPWFSLFKFKRGETEYGIGWLPLGGYVKIAGMIDESMDKEQMKKPPEPWEFRSKPAWQRLIIMLGGVTVNVILGILIYAMVLFHWGEEYLPTENAVYGVACDEMALEMGIQDGDMIISVDGKPVDSHNKIAYEIILNKAKSVQVNRDGQKVDIPVTEDQLSRMIKNKNLLVMPRHPFKVKKVMKNSPAEKAGLLAEDKIIAINEQPTPYFNDVVKIVSKSIGQTLQVKIDRAGTEQVLPITVSQQGAIGFERDSEENYLKFKTIEYGFFESFPAGIRKAYDTFDGYVKQMAVIFTVKDAHKQIGGFLTIGKAYGKTWDWQRFWAFTAFFSIVLAFMNILPIPALDGGHVMFLLYEVITGRQPHEKVMEYAQYLGMILLLALLLYANGNDIVRLFTE